MSWILRTVHELHRLAQLQLFHSIDRRAYAKFVYQLGLDSDMSKKIVAFWNWLETEGYTNFVDRSLKLMESSSSSLSFIDGIALESAKRLACLDQQSFRHQDNDDDLPLMSQVCDKELSLEFVFQNKERAQEKVIIFVRDVCDRAFHNLVVTSNYLNHHQVQPDFVPASELLQPQVNILGQEGNRNHSANRQANNEAYNDRTLFATFSKGHPITKEELDEFFTRRYGYDCVEDIVMGDFRDDQFHYGRVILRSPACITLILGRNEVKQFTIHNKNVRLKRFIPKRAPVAANSTSAN